MKISPEKIVNKYDSLRLRLLIFAAGIICILMPKYPTMIVPYLIGTVMCIAGIYGFVVGFHRREYKTLKTSNIAESIVLFALGLAIVISNDQSLGVLGVIWGFLSLEKGTVEVNSFLYHFSMHEKFMTHLLMAIAEISLGLLLIIDPFDHFELHVVMLGVSMVLYSFKNSDFIENKKDEELIYYNA
ncbi:MAG TPA: DUF308 domain-containing protein [Methanocorpusculum sp.]|nr:DUF308 domain-containing protein [Methanocorpusculum sp.]